MATTDNAPVPNVVASGITLHYLIPSCGLTAEDLRRLYRVLAEKAREAAARQIEVTPQLPRETPEQYEELKRVINASLQVLVRVEGNNGVWKIGASVEPLDDDSLPDSIRRIDFDSAFLYRTRVKGEPTNSFSLTLHFVRTGILDMTTISQEPDSNPSATVISGQDENWVNGVYNELKDFFENRSTLAQGLLHSRYTYDLLVLFFGFPASFALISYVDGFLKPTLKMPDALFVAFYVYLVLVALFCFRILFNYARWVFPKIEGPSRKRGWPRLHRSILSAIALGLIVGVVRGILKMLGFWIA